MASIVDAVTNNNTRILQLLVSGPKAIAKKELNLGLLQAAKAGHADCVECLLVANADTKCRDVHQNTPLHLAVISNHFRTVAMLSCSVSDVNCKGNGKITPLHTASKMGHEESLAILLESGADVNAQDSSGNTSLILAVKNGQYSAIRLLIRKGCEMNVRDNEGLSALHYACHKARGYEQLIKAGADIDIRSNDNSTPLILAAAEGFDNVVKALANAECDVNIANTSAKRTALHIVALKGHSDCVDDLIYAGGDINLYDIDFHTPLWYAVKNKRFEVVKLLLRANSQVDTFQCAPDLPLGACPTRLAISQSMMNVIKLFILAGFDEAHLKSCLREEEALEIFGRHDDMEHWLEHAHAVIPLKQMCRKWIRHQLGRFLYHDLTFLPLPQAMRDYLFMKELDDH